MSAELRECWALDFNDGTEKDKLWILMGPTPVVCAMPYTLFDEGLLRNFGRSSIQVSCKIGAATDRYIQTLNSLHNFKFGTRNEKFNRNPSSGFGDKTRR
jgi:hypothetical protein